MIRGPFSSLAVVHTDSLVSWIGGRFTDLGDREFAAGGPADTSALRPNACTVAGGTPSSRALYRKAIVNRGLAAMMKRSARCPSCMRHSLRTTPQKAFTRVEFSVVIAVLVVITLLVLIPSLKTSFIHAKRIGCVSHLKNIGLAFRTAAVDTGAFVFRLPESKGGTAPYASDPVELWRHFVVLSNELSTPKILSCPVDNRRATYNHWQSVMTNDRNRAISYTVGLDATEEEPNSILSGDRNLSLDGLPVGMSVLSMRAGDRIEFMPDRHGRAGQLLLGDGSVQQVSSARLNEWMTNAVESSKARKIRIVVP